MHAVSAPVGICYGRVANDPPPPSDVNNILKSNGISSVRLFNTGPTTLRSFSGTKINVMIGVPNEVLPSLSSSPSSSLDWLQSNIFTHVPAYHVRYIAVGNEVFLKDPFHTPHLVAAILNLYQALQTLGFANSIKLSSPQAASVLSNSAQVQDGGLEYGNLFDASVDAFVWAMLKERFAGVKVVVTETGWPTSGGECVGI
ncbi:hypothetical protein FNV43_RR25994 [Rhamnella rubrinervis]|uniref:glucan endo-1,3-beta-D-glucosidase n=1 Tax=Rhamnella rubrinervis TaxID=2594499 RepID=A0A8K0DN76_9ROSA|nr:hypothetical protein FNV43_RR25994 [Rhamnella rubrinervis]